MAAPESKGEAAYGDIAACATPVLAQIAAIIAGNELFSAAISIAVAAIFLRMRWNAGAVVASGATGIIIAAAQFTGPYAAANSAANAAYWMICAGVAALALAEMKGMGAGGGNSGGMEKKKAAPYRTRAS
ncbi:MAG: hypothetical protein WC483_01635 [Candidatus Paceibacterota bacterium]